MDIGTEFSFSRGLHTYRGIVRGFIGLLRLPSAGFRRYLITTAFAPKENPADNRKRRNVEKRRKADQTPRMDDKCFKIREIKRECETRKSACGKKTLPSLRLQQCEHDKCRVSGDTDARDRHTEHFRPWPLIHQIAGKCFGEITDRAAFRPVVLDECVDGQPDSRRGVIILQTDIGTPPRDP